MSNNNSVRANSNSDDAKIFSAEFEKVAVAQLMAAGSLDAEGQTIFVLTQDDFIGESAWISMNFAAPQYTRTGELGARLDLSFMRAGKRKPNASHVEAVQFGGSKAGTWHNLTTSLTTIDSLITEGLIPAEMERRLTAWAERNAADSDALPDSTCKLRVLVQTNAQIAFSLRLVRKPDGDLAKRPIGIDAFSLEGVFLAEANVARKLVLPKAAAAASAAAEVEAEVSF